MTTDDSHSFHINDCDHLIGSMLGQYRILELIAEGGMGRIYRADDTLLDRKAAVKIMSTVLSSKAHDRFQREIKTLAALDHETIPRIYGSGITDHKPYIVMEFCEGKSLQELINEQRHLSTNAVITIGIQVAEALSAIHKIGSIHRDIKPSNIMVQLEQESVHAKLTDLGIVHLIDPQQSLTGPGEVLGSLDYISPEHLVPSKLCPASDVYSLGCVLYAALSGKPPSRGQDFCSVVNNVFPPTVSPALQACIQRCLQEVPANRFTSAEELKAALTADDITVLKRKRWPPLVVTLSIVLAFTCILSVILLIGKESSKQTEVPYHRETMQDLERALESNNFDKAEHLWTLIAQREMPNTSRLKLADRIYELSRRQKALNMTVKARINAMAALALYDKYSPNNVRSTGMILNTIQLCLMEPPALETATNLLTRVRTMPTTATQKIVRWTCEGQLLASAGDLNDAKHAFDSGLRPLVQNENNNNTLEAAQLRLAYYDVLSRENNPDYLPKMTELICEAIDITARLPTVNANYLASLCIAAYYVEPIGDKHNKMLVSLCDSMIKNSKVPTSVSERNAIKLLMASIQSKYDVTAGIRTLRQILSELKTSNDFMTFGDATMRLMLIDPHLSPDERLSLALDAYGRAKKQLVPVADGPAANLIRFVGAEYVHQGQLQKSLVYYQESFILAERAYRDDPVECKKNDAVLLKSIAEEILALPIKPTQQGLREKCRIALKMLDPPMPHP